MVHHQAGLNMKRLCHHIVFFSMVPGVWCEPVMGKISKNQAKSTQKILRLPDKNDSLMLIRENVNSVSWNNQAIVFIPTGHSQIIRRDTEQPVDDLKPFSHTKKINIDGLNLKSSWLIQAEEKGYLLLDATLLNIRYYSWQNQLISDKSLWYDRILPAADRGGEAPQSEINQFRSRFKKNLRRTEGPKIVGITPMPSSWHKETRNIYFMVSKIPDFLFLLLSCEKNDPGSCSVYRGCFQSGFKGAGDDVSGIAVDPKSRTLLIGQPIKHQIAFFAFRSCARVQFLRHAGLPGRIKNMSDILVDPKGRLFISTRKKDDYYNASLFRWDEPEWKQ